MTTRLDTTIRPICFGIDKNVLPNVAKTVGPEKFKRYEHILYLMAQLSRIVYCDTGIIHKVIKTSFGMSNDIVNKVITAYDWKYSGKKRQAIDSQPGASVKYYIPPYTPYVIPMESYALGGPGSGTKYGTYISSPEDMTCLFLDTSLLNKNANSILLSTDTLISFKGSSTMENFKHDLMSQFTPGDLQGLITSTGIKVEGSSNYLTGAFVTPLVNSWSYLLQGLNEHIKENDSRIFITGHSLGGAYASLFAFILAEAKVTNTLPIMQKVKSIHLITFGAPCILADSARNTFNRHLDSGLVTLDRVVSQMVSARSAATQSLLGGIVGPNDVIPTIPAGFSHPGYRPLNNPLKNFRPEAKGRPYSMENIRTFYGVNSSTRYREKLTWPFNEPMSLGDRSDKEQLKDRVSILTQVSNIPEQGDVNPDSVSDIQIRLSPEENKVGGASSKEKAIYELATVERIPNFVSVRGSMYASGFAHAEYLGMFFLGGFRTFGMKNPASMNKFAYFELFPNGVTINYKDFKPSLEVKKIEESSKVATEDSTTPLNPNPIAEFGGHPAKPTPKGFGGPHENNSGFVGGRRLRRNKHKTHRNMRKTRRKMQSRKLTRRI